MPDTENGTEDQQQTRQKVVRAASNLYSRSPAPDWVTFFREILGLTGVVRQTYRTSEELAEFEQSEEYAEIQRMLTGLRERTAIPEDPNEPIRVITVRLPKSVHEALRVEAHEHQTSMNKLCISKLLQFIDSQMIPRERWKRVADGRSEASLELEEVADEEAAEHDEPAREESAGVDL